MQRILINLLFRKQIGSVILVTLLLAIGNYMSLQYSQNILDQLKSLYNKYELRANVTEPISIDQLSSIAGIDSITPIIESSAEIVYDEKQLNVRLIGISSNFIRDKLLVGVMFPDEAGMPYIILNEAAYRHIYKVDPIDTEKINESRSIYLCKGDLVFPSIVCGAISDGISEPCAYVNYTFVYEKMDCGPNNVDILIQVENHFKIKNVLKELQKSNLIIQDISSEKEQSDLKELLLQMLCKTIAWLVCAGLISVENAYVMIINEKTALFSSLFCGLSIKKLLFFFFLRQVIVAVLGLGVPLLFQLIISEYNIAAFFFPSGLVLLWVLITNYSICYQLTSIYGFKRK